jgi:hypothetical protein
LAHARAASGVGNVRARSSTAGAATQLVILSLSQLIFIYELIFLKFQSLYCMVSDACSDGSGSSTLKYCEDGLKGIKKAFAAVLRVPPYLAQAHLLSVATTKPPHSDGHANHIVLEDCADNKTDCSSLYSISSSQSAFNNDPSSGLAPPLSLRDSSAIGKFLSPAETPVSRRGTYLLFFSVSIALHESFCMK